MAYLAGYCNLAFANLNNKSDEWSDLSSSEKDYAISIGRMFIDNNYTCSDTSLWDTNDYTTIPDEVQKANSILAEAYVLGTLINYDPKTSGPIVKKKVKAGSVESETTYKGYYSRSGTKLDEHKEVTLLLSPYCTLGNNTDLIRV